MDKHLELLEEFSYMYKESDIETNWLMRTWPMKISADLTEGKNMVAEKKESFGTALEKEKDEFLRQITGFMQSFEKIKTFKSPLNSI